MVVVISGGLAGPVTLRQQRGNDIFRGGLSSAASDAHNRPPPPLTSPRRQPLQCGDRVIHPQQEAAGVSHALAHHRRDRTFRQYLTNKGMTVVVFARRSQRRHRPAQSCASRCSSLLPPPPVPSARSAFAASNSCSTSATCANGISMGTLGAKPTCGRAPCRLGYPNELRTRRATSRSSNGIGPSFNIW